MSIGREPIVKENAMKEKIALFLPSLVGGGAERVMVNLANSMAAKGVRVDLVVAHAEGAYKNQVAANVHIVDFKSARSLASFPKLVGYLRREQPKALISALEHTNVLSIWAKRLAFVSTKNVITEHISSSLINYAAGYTPTKLRATLYAMRFSYPLAEKIVTVSQGVADDLVQTIGINKNKLEVIYNPVLNESMFEKAEQPIDHPWFQPGQPPVLLGVGRFVPQKDFPNLLKAFALLRKKQMARLVILGEGELRPQLESLVKELGIEADVQLPGFNSNPYAFMKRASVFVLSSVLEGLPTVLIEAMALGTPVVSTDCKSGPKEILGSSGYGMLVPTENPEALAAAIEKTLNSPRQTIDHSKLKRYTSDEATNNYLRAAGFQL
jgi:glycosyltransferase involved in cell wall biosynthesis